MPDAQLEVHYVPSEKPQKLQIRFKLEAKRIPHTTPFYQPRLYAKPWADLINAGLAAGARFDPAKSSAKVITDFVPMTELGVHDQVLELEVAGVAAEFLKPIARALLQARFGSSVLFTSAPNADFRVVALAIRGSLAGTSAVDAATLRKWIDDDAVQLPGSPNRFRSSWRRRPPQSSGCSSSRQTSSRSKGSSGSSWP